LRPGDVPEEQHRLARLRLLDTVGLIAAASSTPVCRSMLQWAKGCAGAGSATILIDGTICSPAVAALVHGVLAHSRDFDDTFPESVIHPGSVVIPAALSLAEANDTPFCELSTAIIIGYEVAARLGRVAGRRLHGRGFHATGVVGPIAAAAAASFLLKLDFDATADALGLASSMSSGLLAFLADGGWSKWLHAGWSAHGGITAAELARERFRGPRHGLDDTAGLFAAFIGKDQTRDLSLLAEQLGTIWFGAAAIPKLYPCAHVIQPFIDAALQLREDNRLRVDAITSIRCAIAPWAFPIVCAPREAKLAPQTDLDAIASLPFMLAAAWCDGRADLGTLEDATLHRADIRQLAARIECEIDEALGSQFDGVMTISPADREMIKVSVALATPDANRIRRKFRGDAACLHPEATVSVLESALLEASPRGRELIRLACAPAKQTEC
jgi:2-methylcitrate dehydratase PrpD